MYLYGCNYLQPFLPPFLDGIGLAFLLFTILVLSGFGLVPAHGFTHSLAGNSFFRSRETSP
jgi:hypothetical protein